MCSPLIGWIGGNLTIKMQEVACLPGTEPNTNKIDGTDAQQVGGGSPAL